jgi:hypothetical protein
MGIKSTMAGLTYAQSHINAAEKSAQTVPSLHASVQLRCTELIRDLTLLVATMQTGDPNITTLNNQISALS